MTTKHLQEQLSLIIIRSSMKGKYAITSMAEENHLTLQQALTLCLLDPNQSVPMKALSVFMACDPSNVTVIVEQLVVEGYVERKEADYDRRVKTLTITDTGLTLRDRFLEVTTSTRLPNLDQLSNEEAEQLITLLEKASGANESLSLAARTSRV